MFSFSIQPDNVLFTFFCLFIFRNKHTLRVRLHGRDDPDKWVRNYLLDPVKRVNYDLTHPGRSSRDESTCRVKSIHNPLSGIFMSHVNTLAGLIAGYVENLLLRVMVGTRLLD